MDGITIAIIAVALVGAALPLLAFALAPAGGRPAASVRERLVVHPAGSRARYFAPPALITKLERNLSLAALPWQVGRIVRTKVVLAAAALALGIVFVAAQPAPLRVVLAIMVVTAAYFGPDLVVWGRAQERQEAIRADLADTLDQITISIEAGLGLETAIIRAGEHGSGPLAHELMRTIQDMRVGLSRKEAYTALADRTSVTDLKRFARAIMQADAYGVSVSNVVRTQSKDLRSKRRQRAEEKAMKVPVQVLFPLMLCILPVLFIVVLGPAVANLVSVFATVR